LYSSNSECNNCTLSLIGLQNSYQSGFLNQLIHYLHNESSSFKVRGYDEGDITKFRLNTLVAFDKTLTEQSHHITGADTIAYSENRVTKNIFYNPQGKLSFFGHAINIKERQRAEDNSTPAYNGNFFEFHTRFFQSRNISATPYSGFVFMSGSKNSKLNRDSEREKEVEKKISDSCLN